MTYYIPKLIFISIFILILSGCGMSNLSYNNQLLTMQVDKSHLQLDGELLKVRKDGYGSLFITQKVLRLDEGNVVVYEDARTDIEYEFEPSITRTVNVVFDSQSTVITYAKNHLYAYQLILKDGRVLNVIAQQDHSQQLRMVYGMSSKQLDLMLKKLDPDAKRAYYRQVITSKDTNGTILSKWDVQKVHFVPLVVPLARMSGR